MRFFVDGERKIVLLKHKFCAPLHAFVAEWSKAHVSGTCLNWRGFESLQMHFWFRLRLILLRLK